MSEQLELFPLPTIEDFYHSIGCYPLDLVVDEPPVGSVVNSNLEPITREEVIRWHPAFKVMCSNGMGTIGCEPLTGWERARFILYGSL